MRCSRYYVRFWMKVISAENFKRFSRPHLPLFLQQSRVYKLRRQIDYITDECAPLLHACAICVTLWKSWRAQHHGLVCVTRKIMILLKDIACGTYITNINVITILEWERKKQLCLAQTHMKMTTGTETIQMYIYELFTKKKD